MMRLLLNAPCLLLFIGLWGCSPSGKAQERAQDFPRPVFDGHRYDKPKDDPRLGFVKAEGLPAVPVGLQAYIRYSELSRSDEKIDRLLRQSGEGGFIHALSLRVQWPDLLRIENGVVSIRPEGIGRLIDKINTRSMEKHGTKLPVFLKFFFEFFPSELCAAGAVEQGLAKTIMKDRKNFYCYRLKGKHIPISTAQGYHDFLLEVMDELGYWLEKYDPKGERIPMMAFIGPFMSSNQMRVPNRAAKGHFPPRGASTLPGIDWTKTKHVQAFEKFARLMGTRKHQGFKHRYWVFNYTYPGRYPLSTQDQKRVAEALKASHPFGAAGVLFKTESLCVNFAFKNDKFNPALARSPRILTADKTAPATVNASWRRKMLQDGFNTPYKTIVKSHLSHGWEIYRQFNYKFEKEKKRGRGTQTATMYPLDSMIDNTIYVRPHLQRGLQGTLWVEIKKEEAIRPEKLYRLDNGRPLAPWLREYDNRIREAFIKAYEDLYANKNK